MPYVEGFGTWPFGEEWLWEAVATCYLPLLDVLDAAPGRVTLSVTPVLGDQLEAPGALERCAAVPARDPARVAPARRRGDARPRRWSRRSGTRRAAYERAAAALERGGLPERLAAHATWTSAATHAVLPLLATAGGVRLQLATGIAAHRARSGELARRAVAARVRARAVARRAARGGGRTRGVRRPHRRARPRRAGAAAAAALAGRTAARPARPRGARAGVERRAAIRRTARIATPTG